MRELDAGGARHIGELDGRLLGSPKHADAYDHEADAGNCRQAELFPVSQDISCRNSVPAHVFSHVSRALPNSRVPSIDGRRETSMNAGRGGNMRRREFVAGGATAALLSGIPSWAADLKQFKLGVITHEVTQDFEKALL